MFFFPPPPAAAVELSNPIDLTRDRWQVSPNSEYTEVRVSVCPASSSITPLQVKIRLRVPGWARERSSILTGQSLLSNDLVPGSFQEIWCNMVRVCSIWLGQKRATKVHGAHGTIFKPTFCPPAGVVRLLQHNSNVSDGSSGGTHQRLQQGLSKPLCNHMGTVCTRRIDQPRKLAESGCGKPRDVDLSCWPTAQLYRAGSAS